MGKFIERSRKDGTLVDTGGLLPSNAPAAAYLPCNIDGGVLCDGNGACVECLVDGDCAARAGAGGTGGGVAVDAAGNVFFVRSFDGAIDLGGGPLTSAGGFDAVIVKFDGAGNHVWSKQFGDANHQGANDAAVDSQGNIIIVGSFQGSINFGGGVLTSAGSSDLFVVKLDPAGNHLWSKRFGNALQQLDTRVAVDPADNVVLGLNQLGTIDFGGGPVTSAGGEDVVVVKLSSGGAFVWNKRYGDASGQNVYDIVVDGTGALLLTGGFVGTIDFGGGALTAAPGGSDAFVVKLNPAGLCYWSKRFGGAGNNAGRSVGVDASGNVAVAGFFEGAVDFGGGPLTSAGFRDGFVVKLSAAGGHVWSKRFGDTNDDDAYFTRIDSYGSPIVTGHFNGTIDLGTGPLTSAGQHDIVLAKLAP